MTRMPRTKSTFGESPASFLGGADKGQRGKNVLYKSSCGQAHLVYAEASTLAVESLNGHRPGWDPESKV